MNSHQLDTSIAHAAAPSIDETTTKESERSRIAKDLHDGIGQALTGLKLDVAWLSRRFAESSEARAAISQRLDEMASAIDTAIEELRRVSRGLQPAALDQRELGAALETFARRLAARAGLRLTVDTVLHLPLSKHQAIHLFRIAQEALNNVVRHANADGVWLSLEKTNDVVQMSIRDNGRGLSTNGSLGPSLGSGLANMRDRARRIGAEFQIGRSAQRGTLVVVRLALHRPDTVPLTHL